MVLEQWDSHLQKRKRTSIHISTSYININSKYIIDLYIKLKTIKHLEHRRKPFKVWSESGVPNLWDLMPDDLRWSWCNINRNKVHNKCNVLKSSWNHSNLQVHGKIAFHETSPLAKKVEDLWSRQRFFRFLIKSMIQKRMNW